MGVVASSGGRRCRRTRSRAGEVAAAFPGLSKGYTGALITPSDMRAEPWVAVPALAALAVKEGVRIIENCAVRKLDLAAGRVAGVSTEAGAIRTTSVAGMRRNWSLTLSDLLDRRSPLTITFCVACPSPRWPWLFPPLIENPGIRSTMSSALRGANCAK